jgi:hypothetical protein
MNNPYLLKGLLSGPEIVTRLVDRVTPDQYDRKVDPERFSLREAVAHLADWELITQERLRVAVETSGGGVPDIDEGQVALDHDYAHSDPKIQARLFVERRKQTVDQLERVLPGLADNFVVHGVRGKQTIEDMASMELAHDTYHIDHLTLYL